MADSCSAEQSNSAMEYVMTPETPFTPMGEFRKKKNATYVIGLWKQHYKAIGP